MKINAKITRWLRIIHRDLGFLVVGVTLVYGISGIFLNHLDGKDPAFHTEEKTVTLSSGWSEETLPDAWNINGLPPLKSVKQIDSTHYRLMLNGGIGIYNSENGIANYEIHRKKAFIYWINRLHYSRVKGWSPVADVFAGILLFLAVSGLFIVKGKKGIAGSGKWYLLAGLLFPILWICLS
ncbi:MAG: PepSY-associated TM helix domain-containing protein [Prevotellaceae bacterium]|jgi:hypothetical protein|nr:PepSY-associated TM helix domain-containing protein [Prevotellaceae bacterium]